MSKMRTYFSAEAIVIVQQGHLKDIKTILVEKCEVKIRLDFVAVPAKEEWGTADSLKHISSKIKVSLEKTEQFAFVECFVTFCAKRIRGITSEFQYNFQKAGKTEVLLWKVPLALLCHSA